MQSFIITESDLLNQALIILCNTLTVEPDHRWPHLMHPASTAGWETRNSFWLLVYGFNSPCLIFSLPNT